MRGFLPSLETAAVSSIAPDLLMVPEEDSQRADSG
jgi:hypothetical protein